MSQRIILNFPPGTAGEVKMQFIQTINQKLDPIKQEVNSWNGFIDLRRTHGGNYQFIAICDNDVVREKMEALLKN